MDSSWISPFTVVYCWMSREIKLGSSRIITAHDARKTIKNRIEQLQILEMRSVEIDRNKLDQLNKIYEYLDGFRKDIQTENLLYV